jgi:hypothetical protein
MICHPYSLSPVMGKGGSSLLQEGSREVTRFSILKKGTQAKNRIERNLISSDF